MYRGISLDVLRNHLIPNKKQKKKTRYIGLEDMEGYRYLITNWKELYCSQWWSCGIPKLLKGKKEGRVWVNLGKGKKEDTPILYTLSHTHTTKNPIFKCNDLVETDFPAEFRQLELEWGYP